MIVLENGDKVRGDAAAATTVDYTIYGLDNNALKQLADGQLASSAGDIYTADSTDVITSIVLVNTDTVARAVNLYLQPSGGTARRIIPKSMSLGPGYSLHWSGDKIKVLDTSGQMLMTSAQSASLYESVNIIGSIGGGTQDLDLSLGNVIVATVDTSATTFTISNAPSSGLAGSFTLILTNGGSQTITWPGTIKWPSAVPPALSISGIDVLVFTTHDGSSVWYGFAAGYNLS